MEYLISRRTCVLQKRKGNLKNVVTWIFHVKHSVVKRIWLYTIHSFMEIRAWIKIGKNPPFSRSFFYFKRREKRLHEFITILKGNVNHSILEQRNSKIHLRFILLTRNTLQKFLSKTLFHDQNFDLCNTENYEEGRGTYSDLYVYTLHFLFITTVSNSSLSYLIIYRLNKSKLIVMIIIN